MTDRNWEAELAKIDKQLSSISDDQLVAERKAAVAPGAKPAALPAGKAPAGIPVAPAAAAARPAVGAWASWVKVLVAVAGAVGLMLWPWPAQCGAPLIGFTAAAGAVALLGVWSAIGTWRHRLGLAHAASLLVIGWGLVLGAREVLPRVGYAVPTIERSADWNCQIPVTPTVPAAPVTPGTSPGAAAGASGTPSL